MELPNLGKHCAHRCCNLLDFLPMKCDSCNEIFCKDHFPYAKHNCPNAYLKDVQVPVCPLCSTPVPVKKGELPDIRVGAHIDNDCKSDTAVNKRKVFTNRCSLKGCKGKELIPFTCRDCKKNFCIRHRHPGDHNCPGKAESSDLAREAALKRASDSERNNTTMRSRQEEEDMQLARAIAESEREYYRRPQQSPVPPPDSKDRCRIT